MPKLYHIRDLENLTGIKVHTIRMWEKRYELITPSRSKSNIRYYEESTLKKFLLIVSLYHGGFKISELARFSLDELIEKNLLLNKSNEGFEVWEDDLLNAAMEYNSNLFREIINNCIYTFDLHKAIVFAILPFAKKIDILWKAETLSDLHKNFAYEQITRFFYSVLSTFERYLLKNDKKFLIIDESKNAIKTLTLFYSNIVVAKQGFSYNYIPNIKLSENFIEEIEQFNTKRIILHVPSNETKIEKIKQSIINFPEYFFIILDPNYLLNIESKNTILVNTLEDLDDELIFSA